MKSFLLAILFVQIFISCQSEKDTLENNLRVFFTEKLKKIDSSSRLDTLKFIKLDTVTQVDLLISESMDLGIKNDSLKIEFDYTAEKVNQYVKLARLSRGLSGDLFANYKEEAENYNKQLQDLQRLMKENHEKRVSVLKQSDTADSVHAKYFEAICLLQYTRKDKTVFRDTVFANVNLQKQIIAKGDKLY